jgi:biopolymer transport protein ExbB
MIHFWLQQVGTLATDTLKKVGETTTKADTNIIDIVKMGGFIMIPIGLLLILALYFFFERWIAISKAGKLDENFMNLIRDNMLNGNVAGARSLSKNTNSPVARMVDKGIQRLGKPIDSIDKSMESVANNELYKMEKNLSTISLVAYVAPMFGFLGTIIGMFQLFYRIAGSNKLEINTIADGIYVKMISSAAGIIVGILAYVAHKVLTNMVDTNANKMEVASAEFLDILQEPSVK